MANVEDDKIVAALRQTLQHISLQQSKFKGIEEQLHQTKQQLDREKEHSTAIVGEFESQIEELRKDVAHYRSLSEEQSATISDLQNQTTALREQLESSKSSAVAIQSDAEQKSRSLIQKLEDEQQVLRSKITTLEIEVEVQEPEIAQLHEENGRLQQAVSELTEQLSGHHIESGKRSELEAENERLRETIKHSQTVEEQHIARSHLVDGELEVLKNDNDLLLRRCEELERAEKRKETKCHQYWAQMTRVEQSSLSVLDDVRNLRQSVVATKMEIAEHRHRNDMDFRETSEKLAAMQFDRHRNRQRNEVLQTKYDRLKGAYSKLDGEHNVICTKYDTLKKHWAKL